MVETPPARHDLVAADPDAWADLLAERSDLDGLPHLAGWAGAGRPLIVRRRYPGEGESLIPLGLPLPPADGKRRIGLALPASALRPVAAPDLGAASAQAPALWHPTLDALLALGRDHGIAPRPYGALLWQTVTGLAYVSPSSDLDLLWPGPVPLALLTTLARIEAPMPLDGEIVLRDGSGAQWREVMGAMPGGSVLAKSLDRVAMRPASDFLR